MGDQFAAERGQRSAAAGAAAHLGGDHGPAEAAVQLVDERPGALVRHAHGPPGGRDRAERTELFEQFYLPRPDAPVRVDVDAETQADHGDRSEEHTSELQSLMRIPYAVFCLKNKNKTKLR